MTTNQAPKAQPFDYQRPDLSRAKSIVKLCRSDILSGSVQVVTEGGENNLHSHTGNDGFWMVLGGRARFYTEGDELVGEFGRHQGVMIPRGFKYWFESCGDEPLEILHLAAIAQTVKDERVDYTPLTAATLASFEAGQIQAG